MSNILTNRRIFRAFRPDFIAGLALWLDASDSKYISLQPTTDNVLLWRDRSFLSRGFSQGLSGRRPAYSVSSIQGLNSISFDGAGNILARSPESWGFEYPLNIFIVFQAQSFPSPYNSLINFYTDIPGNFAGWAFLIKSNGKSAIYTTSTTGQPNYDGNGALIYSTGVPNLVSCVIKDGSITSRGNGISDGSFSGNWTSRKNLGSLNHEIGASVTFNRFTPWLIGEVIIYNGSELSATNRDLVEDYLKKKWNILK